MSSSKRLFEIIQILRAASRPITAAELAQKLEVSTRTIYRNIAALQAMQTPIEGEAGIGYMMRRGYDLPPLNFDQEEIEALRVGLLLLSRTGDSMLQKAACRIFEKVDVLHGPADWLQVTSWGVRVDDAELGCVSISMLRESIRNENKLKLTYRDEKEIETIRIIRPIALSYRATCILLAGWCELRNALRHFRTDRIYGCDKLDDRFAGQGDVLRDVWLASYRSDESNM
ncbi:MAG: helix-turn-helix transcriptional regulator [Granulosicoccus sp.]